MWARHPEAAGQARNSGIQLDKLVVNALHDNGFPKEVFGFPLAANLLPWIDSAMGNGQSREEWKGIVETNKILGTKKTIPVDGICVRISSMRCHSQGLVIKLKKDVGIKEITGIIAGANDWVKVVPNIKEETLTHLTQSFAPAMIAVISLMPTSFLSLITSPWEWQRMELIRTQMPSTGIVFLVPRILLVSTMPFPFLPALGVSHGRVDPGKEVCNQGKAEDLLWGRICHAAH